MCHHSLYTTKLGEIFPIFNVFIPQQDRISCNANVQKISPSAQIQNCSLLDQKAF